MAQIFISGEQIFDNDCPKCDSPIKRLGRGSNEKFIGDSEAIFGIWFECSKCGLRIVQPEGNCNSCPTC